MTTPPTIVDHVAQSILTSTFNEGLWKNIYQSCHSESFLKTQKNDECLNFVTKLLTKFKKESFTTSQLKTLFQYLSKIMNIEGALLGNEWNTFLLEKIDDSDGQIQNFLVDIYTPLCVNDEVFRKNLLSLHLTTPKLLFVHF